MFVDSLLRIINIDRMLYIRLLDTPPYTFQRSCLALNVCLLVWCS